MGRLILLAPIAPAPTGNGLAMRSELFRRAAACDFDVLTVVVPAAGRPPESVAGSIVVTPDAARARAGIAALVAEAAWRERLGRLGTLPAPARFASPGLADAVLDRLGAMGPTPVHVMRSYLAPLGTALAERVEAPWTTLDLDEDDAAVARALGDTQEAAAYDRLLGVIGPLFARLSAVSTEEAVALTRRHGVAVEPIPNAVEIPPERPRHRGAALSLLLVGNLTYEPNVQAASVLAREILPEVQRRLGPSVRLRLVGPCDASVEHLAAPDVQVAGFVPDLGAAYAAADVVVVPLRVGGGTRIKLLEAFAHQVPVVASGVAAAGLDVGDERHLLLAESVHDAAAAIERLATDASLARRLVSAAAGLVRERYSTDAVIPTIRDFFHAAASGERPQASGLS